jgi:hypothetical protein
MPPMSRKPLAAVRKAANLHPHKNLGGYLHPPKAMKRPTLGPTLGKLASYGKGKA